MKRLAVFAHYDEEGEIKPYVLHHLRALRAVCQRVVFVSTASLGDAELARARAVCDAASLRPNVGYDFGMWKSVVCATSLGDADELVLTNSSVLGPLWPLEEAFARMRGEACDFWGMTDSHEIDWHLQSYFLVFRASALAAPAFTEFWGSVLGYRRKWQVTLSYELGLTRYLVEAGLRAQAMVPVASLFGSLGTLLGKGRRNPMDHHPLELVRRRVPYVKVGVLRDNPRRVRLGPLRREMRRAGFDGALVAFGRRPSVV
jgi:rhamnosyltransferase